MYMLDFMGGAMSEGRSYMLREERTCCSRNKRYLEQEAK
jgi:hypothetical protein